MFRQLHSLILVIIAIPLWLSGCANTPDPASLSQIDYSAISAETLSQTDHYQSTPDAHHLSQGDVLTITIFGEDELSGNYMIAANGQTVLPLIGEQMLAGKTRTEIQSHVTALYSDGFLIEPIISVAIAKRQPVYILGEVAAPGRYEFENDLQAINVIALAGGYTFRANKNALVITRRAQNSQEQTMLKNVTPYTPIQPGDIITVKERFF